MEKNAYKEHERYVDRDWSITAYLWLFLGQTSEHNIQQYSTACYEYRVKMHKYYSRPWIVRLFTIKPRFDRSWISDSKHSPAH